MCSDNSCTNLDRVDGRFKAFVLLWLSYTWVQFNNACWPLMKWRLSHDPPYALNAICPTSSARISIANSDPARASVSRRRSFLWKRNTPSYASSHADVP